MAQVGARPAASSTILAMVRTRNDTLKLEHGGTVDALTTDTPACRACFVMAHGAGAGMRHPFMQAVAHGLAERHIATLRFQFPFSQAGSRRPDKPEVAHATVRAAVALAGRHFPSVPIYAGGKSFGGRMASQAQAIEPMPRVVGLIFLGFPLHPVGRPSIQRAEHLFDVAIPLLFLHGTRDALADNNLMRQVTTQLGPMATQFDLDGIDHGFERPAGRAGEAMEALVDDIAVWTQAWQIGR